jgi:hypothetical protein
MNLSLYERYSEQIILETLVNAVGYEYKDKSCQFVRTEQGIVFLGNIGVPPSWCAPLETDYPYFHTPDSLWTFLRLSYWSGSPLLSLDSQDNFLHPYSMNEPVWGARDGRICDALSSRLKRVEVFGCIEWSNKYYYLGQAFLTSCGGKRDQQEPWNVHYRLGAPLSREMWIKFGGYGHWLLVIGERKFTVRNYDEATTLIDSLWGKTSPTLQLTRYEGDILRAGLNQNNEVGVMYLPVKGHVVYAKRFDRDCEWAWFSDDEAYSVPVPTLISREQATRIIKSYMITGSPIGLPGFPE